MWPFRKKVRFVDLLARHFGDGSDGPVLIASDDEFVRSYPWVRFTCRGLDYCVARERIPAEQVVSVEVGRADRPGRPDNISAFSRLSLEGMQAYNHDMFYWENVQIALGDPEVSREIQHLKLEQVIETLSGLEPRLHQMFTGRAYASLRARRDDRIEAFKAEQDRRGSLAP